MRHLLRGRQRLARLDEPLDKSDAKSFFGRDRPAGEDEIERAALADQARKPHRAEVDQGDPETPIEHAQGGAGRRDTKVTPQRELESPGHRVALDRRDGRLAEPHACWPHRSPAIFMEPIVGARGQRFEIEAGTEIAACAGQDGDGKSFLSVETCERFFQRSRGVRVDGVAHLRPVDGDGEHRAIDLNLNRSLARARLARCRLP